MKLVINKCYGGFGLSEKAYEFLGIEWDGYGYHCYGYEERDNADLVKCVEALGKEANGRFADLRVVEIPDGIECEIDYYDGIESVHEVHRSW